MIDIQISTAIRQKCPSLQLGCLQMNVQVHPSPPPLLLFIKKITDELAARYELDQISQLQYIHQTRSAYKALGKKPGRYRPSAEALLRRIVSLKGLYQINNVVDILNYISVQSGFSIGGYDIDQIVGTPLLSIGKENEPYDAIARGQLNIGSLPVLRDDLGAFGSPTSDSVRTSVTFHTQRFLMVFFDFGGSEQLNDWLNTAISLLIKYAGATQQEKGVIHV